MMNESGRRDEEKTRASIPNHGLTAPVQDRFHCRPSKQAPKQYSTGYVISKKMRVVASWREEIINNCVEIVAECMAELFATGAQAAE